MKTPILIIILCLCFVRGFCQVSLDSIYVQGATWCGAHYTDYVTNHLGTVGALHSRWTIQMGDDTTVNSKVYKKLYSSLMLDPTKAFAGVRYEKDSNKVYLIMLDSMPGVGWSGYAVHAIYMDTIPLNTEVILYDFNIGKGDTVQWKVGKQKVLLVDTIQLSNGNMARRLFFDTSNAKRRDYWIDGLGSSKSLLGPYLGGVSTSPSCWGASKNCSYTNGGGIAQPYDVDTSILTSPCLCEKPTGVAIVNNDELHVDIYPNPGKSNIVYLHTKERVNSIAIFNAEGVMVYKDEQSPGPGTRRLQVELPAGVYTIQIAFPEGIATKKYVRL